MIAINYKINYLYFYMLYILYELCLSANKSNTKLNKLKIVELIILKYNMCDKRDSFESLIRSKAVIADRGLFLISSRLTKYIIGALIQCTKE